VLASALWHMEPTIDRALKAVMEGRFEAADYGQFSQMQPGGATLAMDEKLVPPDVATAVKEREKEILDGLFRVNVNDAEPKSS
jgi:basic membrane lipoprotein Med (substrate-binding protein (PBP1-ABC) superfamily)